MVPCLGSLGHLLAPVDVRPDLPGPFAVKMPDIGTHMFIKGVPGIEMAQKQMMLLARGLTQRDQVVGVQLQVRMQMERFDMMDLQIPASIPTGHTVGFAQQMRGGHTSPMGTAFMPMPPGDVCAMIHMPTPAQTQQGDHDEKHGQSKQESYQQ